MRVGEEEEYHQGQSLPTIDVLFPVGRNATMRSLCGRPKQFQHQWVLPFQTCCWRNRIIVVAVIPFTGFVAEVRVTPVPYSDPI
jgi:hypothetical protein